MTSPAADRAAWRARVEAELGGADFAESLVTRTLEGLPVEPLYDGESPRLADLGEPGAAPFVRGGRPADGRRWRIAAVASAPDPEAAGEELRADLRTGADACLVRFDRCGRLGLAHHAASNQVGADGTAIADRADLAASLAGIDLAATPIALDAGANALPAAALLLAELEARGVRASAVEAHLGFDAYSAFSRDGALPGSFDDARSELVRLAEHSRAAGPGMRALAVDGAPWHRAGGHVVQELGYMTAALIETMRWLEVALPPAAAAAEVVFRVDVGRDFGDEVAKLRALRCLYAKVMAAAGVANPPPPRIHATTSARSQSRLDPHTNALRATVAAAAAAIGGADWITVLPFDSELSAPGRIARRLAITTQLVLAEECRLAHVADPAAGSHYVEARTLELARAAWETMQDVERRGGLAALLLDGYVAEQLAASRDALTRAIVTRARPVTGVNSFPLGGERLEGDDSARADLRRTAARRAEAGERERARARGRMVLGSVEGVEHAVLAASRGATLAELGGALVRGAPVERAPLAAFREASPFEELRARVAALAPVPRAFVAALGDDAGGAARAGEAADALRACGFEVVAGAASDGEEKLRGDGGGEERAPRDAEELAARFEASRASIACFAAGDASIASVAPRAIERLRDAGATAVLVAAAPADEALRRALVAAGATGFLDADSDLVEVAGAALESLGRVASEAAR